MTMTPHILAVDDDAVNLDIIDATFEDSGYALRFAKSGKEALALLEDDSYHADLIILDRMMPGMDGIEVLRRIKAQERLASIPVVMQTAAAAPDQVAEGLVAGAHYYLTKPYAPASLRCVVRSALEEARHHDADLSPADYIEALRHIESASLAIRTLDDAACVAGLLAQSCPNPDRARMALAELLINAVEHGNLEISYADKTRLKHEDRWRDEVERRCQLPVYRNRYARVQLERGERELRFTITDEGPGFAWQQYMELSPSRAFDPNGRGIAMARMLGLTSLHYEGRGNVAVAMIALD